MVIRSAALAVVLWTGTARAQTVTATVAAGSSPGPVAVNPVTNRIYVVNGDGTVTVIE
jgi:DNA-binding beta-propeller fold protein YncE